MFLLRTASKPNFPDRKRLLSSCRGFTLLEVMIAVSIIALVFVSIFRMQSGTIRLAEAGTFNTLAPVLANQVLLEMEQDLEDQTRSSGEFEGRYSGYKWASEVSDNLLDLEFIDEDYSKGFKKITLRIMDKNEHHTYEVTTWRYAVEE